MDNNNDHNSDHKTCNKTMDEVWSTNFRPNSIHDVSFWLHRNPWMCERCLRLTVEYMLKNKAEK